MAGEAAKLAREREREAYEKTRLTQLPPTDPIRRAKALDKVPAPADTGAPNGTAGKADGADGSPSPDATDPTAKTDGPPTPLHMPEVQPTTAKEPRPAKVPGTPGLSSKDAEAAATAEPNEKPKTRRAPAKKEAE